MRCSSDNTTAGDDDDDDDIDQEFADFVHVGNDDDDDDGGDGGDGDDDDGSDDDDDDEENEHRETPRPKHRRPPTSDPFGKSVFVFHFFRAFLLTLRWRILRRNDVGDAKVVHVRCDEHVDDRNHENAGAFFILYWSNCSMFESSFVARTRRMSMM